MRHKFVITSLFIVIFTAFVCSCSSDEKTYTVRFVITSDTPGALFHVLGAPGGLLTTKNRFEYETQSEEKKVYGSVTCDDDKALITVEIYVNGRHYRTLYGNGMVDYGVDLSHV